MTRKTNGQKPGSRIRRLSLVASIILVAALAFMVYWYEYRDTEEKKIVSQPTAVETSTISPDPTNRPVKLVAEIPSLTDEQRWYKEVVEMILDDPERWVEKKKVVMSANDREVFLVLMMTESSLYQFDTDGSTLDSGIDCDGVGQVCNGLCDLDKDGLDLRYNPFENVYCALDYFGFLINKHDGNYFLAVAEYKDSSEEKADGTIILLPDHKVVRDLFDHLTLR